MPGVVEVVKRRQWSSLRQAVQLGTGVLLLAWLVRAIEIERLVQAAATAREGWLVGGLSLLLGAVIPASARLKALVRGALPFSSALRLTVTSYLFNQLLPTGLGGDLYRAARLKPRIGTWGATAGLLTLERAISFGSILLPALCLAFLDSSTERLLARLPMQAAEGIRAFVVLMLSGALLTTVLLAKFRSRARAGCFELRMGLRSLSVPVFAWVTILSLCFHASRVAGVYCLVAAMGFRLPLPELIVVMSLALLTTLLPISIGALGVQEGAIVYGLAAIGVPAPVGFASALLNRGVLLAIACAGALLLALERRHGWNAGIKPDIQPGAPDAPPSALDWPREPS